MHIFYFYFLYITIPSKQLYFNYVRMIYRYENYTRFICWNILIKLDWKSLICVYSCFSRKNQPRMPFPFFIWPDTAKWRYIIIQNTYITLLVVIFKLLWCKSIIKGKEEWYFSCFKLSVTSSPLYKELVTSGQSEGTFLLFSQNNTRVYNVRCIYYNTYI